MEKANKWEILFIVIYIMVSLPQMKSSWKEYSFPLFLQRHKHGNLTNNQLLLLQLKIQVLSTQGKMIKYWYNWVQF